MGRRSAAVASCAGCCVRTRSTGCRTRLWEHLTIDDHSSCGGCCVRTRSTGCSTRLWEHLIINDHSSCAGCCVRTRSTGCRTRLWEHLTINDHSSCASSSVRTRSTGCHTRLWEHLTINDHSSCGGCCVRVYALVALDAAHACGNNSLILNVQQLTSIWKTKPIAFVFITENLSGICVLSFMYSNAHRYNQGRENSTRSTQSELY